MGCAPGLPLHLNCRTTKGRPLDRLLHDDRKAARLQLVVDARDLVEHLLGLTHRILERLRGTGDLRHAAGARHLPDVDEKSLHLADATERIVERATSAATELTAAAPTAATTRRGSRSWSAGGTARGDAELHSHIIELLLERLERRLRGRGDVLRAVELAADRRDLRRERGEPRRDSGAALLQRVKVVHGAIIGDALGAGEALLDLRIH